MTHFNENLYYTVDNHVTGACVKHSISVIKFPGGEINVDIGAGRLTFRDPGKKSAKGRLFVGIGENGAFELKDGVTKEVEEAKSNLLKVFYRDGVFLTRVTLNDIRERSK